MRTFIASVLGGLIALILFVGIFFVAVMGFAASLNQTEPLPDKIVLSYDMRSNLTDQSPISFFDADSPGHIDVILRMQAAETDDAVVGMYIRMAEGNFLPARADEMRQAIKSFQEAGKWVIAYTQDMTAPSMPSKYYAVSAADEIWIQPDTSFLMFGVAGSSEFYGGLFEKLDAKAEIFAAHEYKNAANSYTQTGFTEAHKSQMQLWINSIWATASVNMAEDRGMTVDELKTILKTPYSAEDSVEVGLTTGLYWPEEASDAILERAGKGADFLGISAYKPNLGGEGPTIAVVGGEGAVMTGEVQPFQNNGYSSFKSDYLAEQILAAGKASNVDAVVFRVDSGGGSVTASAQIWRAVSRVREEYDKPVIISMGTLAASGGYWVSAPANKIVANPTTITGSIGAFVGKFATSGTFEKVGITSDSVNSGNDLTTLYDNNTLSPGGREVMESGLNHVYDRFLEIVSDGRGISVEDLDTIARGRVWTGQQALDLGLVDELGSIVDAIALAATEVDPDHDEKPKVVFFPDEKARQAIIYEGIPFLSASADMSQMGVIAKDYGQVSALLNQPEIQRMVQSLNTVQAQDGTAKVEADIPNFN